VLIFMYGNSYLCGLCKGICSIAFVLQLWKFLETSFRPSVTDKVDNAAKHIVREYLISKRSTDEETIMI
jgi:hypothetical protein